MLYRKLHDTLRHALNLGHGQFAVSIAAMPVIAKDKDLASQGLWINAVDKLRTELRAIDQTLVVNVCNVLTIGKANTSETAAVNDALDIFEAVNLNS